jgi:hypothetical protein
MPAIPGTSVTKTWRVMAAVAVIVFAVAFLMTAFNDVKPLSGFV